MLHYEFKPVFFVCSKYP